MHDHLPCWTWDFPCADAFWRGITSLETMEPPEVWGIARNSMEWPRCQYPTHMVGQCWLYQYSQGFVGWPISSQHAHCFGRGIHLCHEHVQRIALRSDRNVPEVVTRGSSSTLLGGLCFAAGNGGWVPFYGHFTGENEVSSILGCNGDLSELTSYGSLWTFVFFCFRLWLLLRSFFTLVQSAGDKKSGQGRYLWGCAVASARKALVSETPGAWDGVILRHSETSKFRSIRSLTMLWQLKMQ